MGLILPRNQIAYPGGFPGFDPSHVASAAPRLSAVACGGSFLDLLHGNVPVLTGTVTSAVTSIGPVVQFPAANSYFTLPGTIETPTSITLAAISTHGAYTFDDNILLSTGQFNNNDVALIHYNDQFEIWYAGGTIELSSPTLTFTPGVPYFTAISVYNSPSSGLQCMAGVMVNLQTGKCVSGTNNGSVTLRTFASANMRIGGAPGGGNFSANGNVAAVMMSLNGLTLGELLEWAKAPWDFWYPPQIEQGIFASLGRGAPTSNSTSAMLIAGL